MLFGNIIDIVMFFLGRISEKIYVYFYWCVWFGVFDWFK